MSQLLPEDDEVVDFTAPTISRTPSAPTPPVQPLLTDDADAVVTSRLVSEKPGTASETVVTASVTPRPARRRPREIGPLGLPEAIALAAGVVLVLTTLLAYFFVLEPNRAAKTRLETQRTDARADLLRLQDKRVTGETTQQSVERIAQSVVSFERNSLARSETGRLILYRQLTEIMLRNGVRNTAGPAYAELAALKPEESGRRNNAGQKGSDRWQSIYPGLSVNVTVEGTYTNVRRFVRDVEGSGLFLIINAVEVEGSRNQDAASAVGPNAGLPSEVTASPASRRGSLVNLRLDLAAYFQRNGLDANTN